MAKVVLAQLDATPGIFRVEVGSLGGIVIGREHRPTSRYFLYAPDPSIPGSGDLHEIRGEDFAEAARRELHEETGIQDADFIFETPGFLYYDFPPSLKIPRMTDRYRGQQQKWYLAYWNHPAESANLKTHTQEFARVQFMPMAEATNQIVPFKRDIYKALEREFLPLIDDFLKRT